MGSTYTVMRHLTGCAVVALLVLCTLISPTGAVAQQASLPNGAETSEDDGTLETSPSATPPVYTYWHGRGSEARKPFEAKLLQMLFKLSEERYGKATFVMGGRDMSRMRMIKSLRRGDELDFMISPFINRFLDQDAAIVLPYPVLNNFLGYRQVVVRKRDLEKFRALDSHEEFKHLIVGQLHGWADVAVFEHNKIDVVTAPRFDTLFSMLHHDRFDYISLGITEIEKTLQSFKSEGEELVIVDNLVLYYPWPVHLMVSVKRPELAERLDYAMQKALSSGAYKKLFESHFQQITARVNRPEVRLIELATPKLETTHYPANLKKATRIK